jgi:transposase
LLRSRLASFGLEKPVADFLAPFRVSIEEVTAVHNDPHVVVARAAMYASLERGGWRQLEIADLFGVAVRSVFRLIKARRQRRFEWEPPRFGEPPSAFRAWRRPLVAKRAERKARR